MAGVAIHSQPAPAIGRLLDATRQAGLERLQAVLVCTFTFDRNYFEQVLDGLADCHPDGKDLLREIPIDVVCDHRHYRGHGPAYNVHCWGGSNLFHPKLLLLLFSDRVIWIEGSLNMTRAGYSVNTELVSYSEHAGRRLPHGVHVLVDQLAASRVEAAIEIVRSTARARRNAKNRSLTSIDAPILAGRLPSAGRARSVHVVSPFFDKREQAGASLDATALGVLANTYPDAQFRIYVPEITRADGRQALQASKAMFESAFGARPSQLRVAICGVPSEKRPLHAKLIAVRAGRRGGWATVLAGSPNLTEVALLRKGKSANVELARVFVAHWKHVERFLSRLGRKFKSVSACLFEPPRSAAPSGWHALKSAVYNPLRRELTLEWNGGDYVRNTLLYYVGRPVAIPQTGPIRDFAIRAGELRMESVRRGDTRRRSWCPIVVPFTARLALAELPAEEDPPPEWWLLQLGALPPLAQPKNAGADIGPRRNVSLESSSFSMGERVRDLAGRMEYALDTMTEPPTQSAARIDAHLALVERIFDTHDPGSAQDVAEQAWRLWVRLEITQMLKLAASRSRLVRSRSRSLQRRLRRAIRAERLPQDMAHQWKRLTASVT